MSHDTITICDKCFPADLVPLIYLPEHGGYCPKCGRQFNDWLREQEEAKREKAEAPDSSQVGEVVRSGPCPTYNDF